MLHRPKHLIKLFYIASILFSATILIQSAAAQSGSEPAVKFEQGQEAEFKFSMPILFRPPDPPPVQPIEGLNKTLFCSNSNQLIPDNYPAGMTSTLRIDDSRYIGDLDVRIDIDHTWVGDLAITLQHEESGRLIELVNRPGVSPDSTQEGCRQNNIKAILDDDVSLPVENECSSFPAAVGINEYIEVAIAGIYNPEQRLDLFDGGEISGSWTLTVSDSSPHDNGQLNQWCLAATLVDNHEIPPQIPPPSGLPRQASISGISGQRQALPLDCESRSAVDWARFFGFYINEYEFFDGLPSSDNPSQGFVGNVWGTWGQIPPAAYGVHAEPIAKRLRQYGLTQADAQQYLTWNHLKAEIAAGRPVIVWILGSGYSGYEYVVPGIPIYYQSDDGQISTVARFEHTVILTGYDQESVTYLNGANIYQKSLKEFLQSWSALGNMAVVYQP